MITAEEFIKDLQSEQGEQEYKMLFAIDIPDKLIEFDKLHVEAALKAAYENSEVRITENSFTIEDMEDFELWKQKQFYIFNHHTKKWISENDEDENTMCIERTTADLIQLWQSEKEHENQ